MTAPPSSDQSSPVRWAPGPADVLPSGQVSRPREFPASMHTTLVATDISGFGHRYRDIDAQTHIRQLMYEQLAQAFAITGIRWWDCYAQDRGDGALIIAPPDISTDRFLDPLVHHLHAVLRRHNCLAGDATRLQLRMALHHGLVCHDGYGVTGHAATHLFRLLEAAAFKKTLVATRPDLGVVVSDQLYIEARQRGGLFNPDAYQRLRISCKETRAQAWLWLPPASR